LPEVEAPVGGDQRSEVEDAVEDTLDDLDESEKTKVGNSFVARISRRGGSAKAQGSNGSGFVATGTTSTLKAFAGYSGAAYCEAGAIRAWSCVGCKDGVLAQTKNADFFKADSTGMQG
jgi:hypothetical protein